MPHFVLRVYWEHLLKTLLLLSLGYWNWGVNCVRWWEAETSHTDFRFVFLGDLGRRKQYYVWSCLELYTYI